MEDQVAALRQAGVKAAALNSRLWGTEKDLLRRDIEAGELDLLYVAPETLLKNLDRLKSVRLCLIAIDEAHCVSQRGLISGPNIAPSTASQTSSPAFRALRSPPRRMRRPERRSSNI